jgi:hypothetical protein
MFEGTYQFGVLRAAEQGGGSAVARREALRLFRWKLSEAHLLEVWGGLIGRRSDLLQLADVQRIGGTAAGHTVRIRAVSIARIRGSEGRAGDFDWAFRPRQHHLRDRWLSVASARLCGVPLPRVSLIRVGDDYFVRDGHHRISVARALGEAYIDAEVV